MIFEAESITTYISPDGALPILRVEDAFRTLTPFVERIRSALRHTGCRQNTHFPTSLWRNLF